MVSIIIRTKNEERWITQCLRAVFAQDYPSFEVILVDNKSKDSTVKKALAFPVKLVEIDKFLPGAAINDGIRASRGDILVCISGHCIPVSKNWLKNLVADLKDPKVAGVYGRQEPLPFTPDVDKRDLINTFGLDKRRQKKDSFFHNANSAFRRDLWEKIPFDETVTNIEDRVWGEAVTAKGYEIVYEPEASVYHFHGIHHSGDPKRCENVVKILESLTIGKESAAVREQFPEPVPPEVVAVIPYTGPVKKCGGKPLLEYTIQRAKEARSISKIFVTTDNPEVAEIAKKAGAEVPGLRPKELCGPDVSLDKVLRHTLSEINGAGIYPDAVVCLTASYPFRRRGFLDYLIKQFFTQGLDTLLPVQEEGRSAWFRSEQKIEMVSQLKPRHTKSDHLYVSLLGLGCVTLPSFIRESAIFGKNLGVHLVRDGISQLELRDDSSLAIADELIEKFFLDNQDWNAGSIKVDTVEELGSSSHFRS